MPKLCSATGKHYGNKQTDCCCIQIVHTRHGTPTKQKDGYWLPILCYATTNHYGNKQTECCRPFVVYYGVLLWLEEQACVTGLQFCFILPY